MYPHTPSAGSLAYICFVSLMYIPYRKCMVPCSGASEWQGALTLLRKPPSYINYDYTIYMHVGRPQGMDHCIAYICMYCHMIII